jgi:uridine kinase
MNNKINHIMEQNDSMPLQNNAESLNENTSHHHTGTPFSRDFVQIRCKNNKKIKNIAIGSTLLDVYREFNLNMPFPPVSAKVNNKVEGLHFRLYHSKDVEFLDVTNSSGMRTYTRSLFFVLVKAVEDLFPDGRLRIAAPISKGYYCKLFNGHEITLNDVINLKKRMQEIIDKDIPFVRVECPTDEAIEMFRKKNMTSKVRLLKSLGSIYTYYYRLDKTVDYFYGSLLPSTGGLRMFDLVRYYDGILLRIPSSEDPTKLQEIVKQEKMFDIFQQHHRLQELLGINTVGDFNEACLTGHTTELINVSEAIQEKRIVSIAEDIANRSNVKMVLISGPSSSGKTTFSKRLSVQLLACGLRPYPISLDNYFVDRESTPKDENGNYDFESFQALDTAYFNQQLTELLAGKEIELPHYNFQSGQREPSGEHLTISDNTILILEGIHALNPALTSSIPEDVKFRVYVSALTTILLDDHNYIPTTDNRLLRRIIRDYKYRGYSAEETIKRWDSVRRGEDKWIFPYQENANAMFNSALVFEIAAIRTQALPLLDQVPENSEAYSEAYRLSKFLHYFVPMNYNELPPTSLLREFLGGSSFKY